MDLSASSSSDLVFRLSDGTRVEAPLEWLPARVAVPIATEHLSRVRLLRGPQELPLSVRPVDGLLSVEADWPRSGPGQYELSCPELGLSWRVRVDSRKISPASLQSLVEDLQFRLLASLGMTLQRMGGLVGVKLLPPDRSTLAGELHRLTRTVELLSEILPAIARDPHGMLDCYGLVVPRERARRPTVAGMLQAYRQGGNLDSNRALIRLEDSRVEPNLDVVENRMVRTLLDQVRARLQRVDRLTSTRTLREKFHLAVLRAPFLAEVRPLAGPLTTVSMVMLKRPPYRAALRLLQDLRREPAVELREPALQAPLENLPYLYECWGVMQALVVLAECAEEAGYRVSAQRLVHLQRGEPFFQVLRDGHPALVLEDGHGARIQAIPQRRYAAKTQGLHSLTFAQIPDLAIERQEAEGRVSVVILDPKYKLDSEELAPQKADIDKMHAYRDAIRDANGQAVVRAAWILYPGQTVPFCPEVQALRAVPGEDCTLDLRELARGILGSG